MHTVLIADDDGRIAAVLGKALGIHGIAARVIGDGDAVLAAALSGRRSVVGARSYQAVRARAEVRTMV